MLFPIYALTVLIFHIHSQVFLKVRLPIACTRLFDRALPASQFSSGSYPRPISKAGRFL